MTDHPGRVYRRTIAVDARPLSTPLSGVARVISRILKNYPDQEGTRFILYSHRGWNPAFQDVVELPNVVWVTGRGPLSRLGGLWFNLALPFILRKSGVDLFWGSQQILPPFLPRKLPAVLTYYDLVLYFFPRSMRPLARWQQRAFQRSSVRRANRILSISDSTRQDMNRKFHYPPERSEVSLLGYEPAKGEVDSAVEKISSPFIFSVSTLEPRKNYGTLLKAYRVYLDREKEAALPLIIAGKRGWESDEFFRLLADLEETGMVRVLEGLNDASIEALYKKQAFFVLASLYEGFGLSLLESLCVSGKPALVSDIGSFREIGKEMVRYLPPTDSGAWASALVDMTRSFREGKLKSIRFPKEEWTWERTARAHQLAFEELS